MAQQQEFTKPPEFIPVLCKCGTQMILTQPEQCAISIGLTCKNKKCNKVLQNGEWFYHCALTPIDQSEHKGPYNYCIACAKLKHARVKKDIHITVLKQGWMCKKPTNHLRKNKDFKRRYFRLGMDWKLKYFVRREDEYNKDTIDLNF